jgi:hypothetical protein
MCYGSMTAVRAGPGAAHGGGPEPDDGAHEDERAELAQPPDAHHVRASACSTWGRVIWLSFATFCRTRRAPHGPWEKVARAACKRTGLRRYVASTSKLDGSVARGKLHLIDLAGSERIDKARASGMARPRMLR